MTKLGGGNFLRKEKSCGELRPWSGLGGKRGSHMQSCNGWGFSSGRPLHPAQGPWTLDESHNFSTSLYPHG